MKKLTTAEMQKEYTVIGFGNGCVVVIRKIDNVKGSLDFDHSPRLYYDFVAA